MFTHKKNTLVAWLLRSRNLTRWPLMHTFRNETVAQHSFEVAVIAYKLAVIAKVRFSMDVNPERVCTLAVMHEAQEAAGLSDLPSPLKYANPELTSMIKKIEESIENSLLNTESDEMIRDYITPMINQRSNSDSERFIVKTADYLSMFIKASGEYNDGNREFSDVIKKLTIELDNRRKNPDHPEVEYFVLKYLPECLKTLDELI
ncbi:5'-deoxynucleotidase [Vibrio sp. 1180_3]|uniref:5'-deoxynucleotidase n=1 Tax=Vibrio sp. 1180_3 TaxID=2528832 RepID=UPI00240745A1|nr:5'-deoxynucleotidase [Vibrio sp. 1180_3]MDF9399148.1 5'-deoxynucleotidase [Vibrio sp. 1180_3]